VFVFIILLLGTDQQVWIFFLTVILNFSVFTRNWDLIPGLGEFVLVLFISHLLSTDWFLITCVQMQFMQSDQQHPQWGYYLSITQFSGFPFMGFIPFGVKILSCKRKWGNFSFLRFKCFSVQSFLLRHNFKSCGDFRKFILKTQPCILEILLLLSIQTFLFIQKF
jgi:hypothetical protein